MCDYLHIGRASELIDPKDRRVYRLFEIIPGFLAWLTLVLIVVLSFLTPVFVAVFIIIFDVYWLIKTIYLSLHLRVSYNRLKQNLKINWLDKLSGLRPTAYSLQHLKSWADIYHLIFLPLYREDISLVSATMEGLLRTHYPKEKMMVILCWEERGGEATKTAAREVERMYANKFYRFLSIMHPANLSDEMPGKGSNTAYAARIVKEHLIDKLATPYGRVLVSNFDVDTIVFPEYFGILTYTFLTTENPLHASYQPVPLYINNIWEAPSFARVVAFSATFWHTIKQEKHETATTFSSHSMPWTALVDAGFWQKNMVSEDSRIFWQCFLRYDGDYRVVPLYYPVSMDANVAHTTWQTFKNVYKQQRRWGYGVENIPYFLFGFWKNEYSSRQAARYQEAVSPLDTAASGGVFNPFCFARAKWKPASIWPLASKNKLIPRFKKWKYGFFIIEGFHSWATNALIIFLLGWLPVIVGGGEFNKTILSFNLPYITRFIMTLAMVGLVSTAILSIILLPPRPPKFGKFKYLWMALQWLLFPITTIGLGLLPGLEAQTRLMLGYYMGFWFTPKARR